MTFEEAMAYSLKLKNDVNTAIALRLPVKKQRDKLNAYVQFNPYMYAIGAFTTTTAPIEKSDKP